MRSVCMSGGIQFFIFSNRPCTSSSVQYIRRWLSESCVETVPINQWPPPPQSISIDIRRRSFVRRTLFTPGRVSLRRGSLRRDRKLSLANFQEQENWDKYAGTLRGARLESVSRVWTWHLRTRIENRSRRKGTDLARQDYGWVRVIEVRSQK